MERKKTILLVEDETIIALSEKITLEKFGYTVVTAISGEKAVELFVENPSIDLILMDIDLGKGIDGTEAAASILSVRAVPVVFLSSHTEPEVVEKTEKITSYGYVVKNSSVTVLDASIKMAFKLFDANNKILENEIRQNAMLSNIDDVIEIIGTDHLIKYSSPNIEKWFGWTQKDQFGKNAWDSVDSGDLPRIEELFGSILERDSGSATFEFRYRCRDGSFKPVELTAINLINHPVIRGILVSYHDITERRLAQKSVLDAESKFRALFEKGPIGVAYHEMMYDEDGKPADYRFLDANESYLELTGVDPRGKTVTQAFPGIEKDPFDWIGKFAHVALTGEEMRFEQYLEANDRWYDVVAYQFGPDQFVAAFSEISQRKKVEEKLQRKNEEYEAVNEELRASLEELQAANEELRINTDELRAKECALHQDIEFREKTEKALAQSERKLEMMFQNIVDGMVTVDLPGRINYSNAAAERILGLRKNLVGKYYQDRFWQQVDSEGNPIPEDMLPLSVALREKRIVQNYVHQIVSPGGGQKWLSINASPLFDSDGTLSGAIASFRDITELKISEERIILNESRLQRLLNIMQHPSGTIQEFLDYTLEQAIELTGSKIGYIYHYNEDKKEFILNTWSKNVMVECMVINPLTCYELDKTGIWGEAVRQRRPIIINDFKLPDPLKKGLPRGHVPLHKFMTIPVFVGNRIAGVVGLANKSADYDETDILQVTLLMDVVWKVTEQKKADEDIKGLLAEKNLILKEVHHRIKNNMNTVYGLLALQAGTLTDDSAVRALEDAGRRVLSMMLLYEKLYQAADVNALSLGEYLPALLSQIQTNFSNREFVRIETVIGDIYLSAKKLQPLGILVNELITNCMKYAFAGRDAGLVTVSAQLSGTKIKLTVADDGVGIPESVDFGSTPGFGLSLASGLADQLEGSIRIERKGGTQIILEFEQ